jgi:hypothetical protein
MGGRPFSLDVARDRLVARILCLVTGPEIKGSPHGIVPEGSSPDEPELAPSFSYIFWHVRRRALPGRGFMLLVLAGNPHPRRTDPLRRGTYSTATAAAPSSQHRDCC